MFKKIIYLVILAMIFSCGSTKTVVSQPKIIRKTMPVVEKKLPAVVKKPALPKIVKVEVPKKEVPKAESNPQNSETSSSETNSNSTSIEVLTATTQVKVTTEIVNDYINKYKLIAKTDMIKYGIPASITLAQGILESGAGTGPLSKQANNHFGIKCHKDWMGESVRYDDDIADECFRKYNDPFDSYNDHSMFLYNRPRYATLFKLPKNDYKSWSRGLKTAGYATDVNYPSKLIGLIERYQLFQYDNEVLGNDFNQVVKNVADNSVDFQKKAPEFSQSKKNHIVEKGDTLYSLSKKYNISVADLKQKNGISETDISLGQTLIIR